MILLSAVFFPFFFFKEGRAAHVVGGHGVYLFLSGRFTVELQIKQVAAITQGSHATFFFHSKRTVTVKDMIKPYSRHIVL